MLIFNGFFGSYALRQLIADHINYNKDVYIDHIEGDFSKYVEIIGRIGGIVELFAFSSIIDVWIELWCDVKDSWIRNLKILYLIEKIINNRSINDYWFPFLL